MKIVIAGETFAENLGDGVISKTLGYLVKEACPEADLANLDISGRTGWQSLAPPVGAKRPSLAANIIPVNLRRLARWHFFGQRSARRRYFRSGLKQADLLLIGGGQLMMDSQLQFPLSLELLSTEARALNIPVQIVCCGVGSNWSALGKYLIGKVLRQADKIAVRDIDSSNRLTAEFGVKSSAVLIDPALWSKEVFAENLADQRKSGRLGLGVISAAALDEHLRKIRGPVSSADLIDRWIDIIAAARAQYAAIELFTNGHPDDFELANTVAAAVKSRLGYECNVARQPRLPEQLVQDISGYSAVVAYRLHACIIAASLGLPVVGIEWDQKVRSFFRDLDQESNCLAFESASPESILKALDNSKLQSEGAGLVEAKKGFLLNWLRENLRQ